MMPQQAVRRIQLASLAAVVIAASPAGVSAEGGRISLRADLEYLYAEAETKAEKTTSDSEFSRLRQKYDVELQKEIFPFLEFRTGGIFELIDAGTAVDAWNHADGIFSRDETGSDETTSWLFAELNLDNPLYRAGTAYRRRKLELDSFSKRARLDSSGVPTREEFDSSSSVTREEFSGLFRWRPAGLPTFDLDVESVHAWNSDDTRDLTIDRVILENRYDYRDFSYDYTYTRNDTDDEIRQFGSLTQSHIGGMQYSADFFNDRLELTSAARLSYQLLEPRREGQIEEPTIPRGDEFYIEDDSDPEHSDPGDITEVNGRPLSDINIGVGNLNPLVAVGLDFGFPTAVDRVHVLPLPKADFDDLLATPGEIASVANGYEWRVFWSDDQETWNEIVEDVEAIYAVIEDRFEISFARVNGARFIKVVVNPQPDIPWEIRTAEIRAFTTFDVSPGMEIQDFDQNFNLGLRWAFSDRTDTSYEAFFRYRNTKPFDTTRLMLTNSISLRHLFSPKLVASARILRTDSTRTGRDDVVHHSYTASLRADHLDTFRQTLVYSGLHDDVGGGPSFANSLFLRTDADFYAGWSSNLDLGFSWERPVDGGDFTSSTLRIGTKLDPHPRLNFAIDYRFTLNTETGEPSWIDQNARFQGFWVPIRTLSFFAAVRLRYRERESGGLKVSQDYSVNWAPFPDGLLRLSLGYNQSVVQPGKDRIGR
jgi:hypothetical protein